jgi:hypothetical protein
MNRAMLSWNQITLVPGQFWLALLYPSVGFALWHLAPMSIFPYKGPGGRSALVAQVWFLSWAFSMEELI